MKRIAVIAALMLAFFGTALLAGCAQNAATPASSATERIGIIGAMDEEVAALKDAASNIKATSIAGMEFCEATLGGKGVVIVQCGMGKVNAGICAHTLINEFGCTRIINAGVAGALDSSLDIGDIVVSTDAVQHDFDVEAIGFEKGEIPYTGLYAFPADETLRSAALQAATNAAAGSTVVEGRVCSGDQFISTVEQKSAITSAFGGLCCEMEGGAVAQACYLNNTPFVIIRTISDKSDGSNADEYEAFKLEGAVRSASIVMEMVESL